MWTVFEYYPLNGIVTAVSTVVLWVTGYYVLKWLTTERNIEIKDMTHSWKNIKLSSKAWCCSVCEELLLNSNGMYCDSCGVYCDSECLKKANVQLPCKVIASKVELQKHHWVKGNLPLGALCSVCYEECAVEQGLVDYQCCWCHRNVHEECLSKLEEICDFGPFKQFIVPPWCVQVFRRKGSSHKHLKGVKHPGWDKWNPVVIVGNKKSGNNDGELVLSEFKRYLNPAQVMDLSECSPIVVLQWSILLAPKLLRMLIAGGDGTIAWILSSIHKLALEPEPAIGIVPLGTGNDLSRVLGWGSQHPTNFDVLDLLKRIESANTTLLDRWKIEFTSPRPLSNLGIRLTRANMYMYNYVSIGVDAQVTLDFHKARSSRFYPFGSRFFNKIMYLCFGTQQVVAADCRNLEQRLDIFLDDVQIELPELESIVILNIPSWGAGVNLWGDDFSATNQSYHDGILEVVGVYSSFHIAQLQVGLSKPYRIGQARKIEIHLHTSAPIQVDGEPWQQHPAHIRVSLENKTTVLINAS
ncbi:hypothetical protein FQA39_LY03085 [Lamprigera yunnana]|nr:hypothetical protein FQA39_LY03085 [Lamprigera yunnana]